MVKRQQMQWTQRGAHLLLQIGKKGEKERPLWRSMTKERGFGDGRMTRVDVYRMIKRRCRQAEMESIKNRVLRQSEGAAITLRGRVTMNSDARRAVGLRLPIQGGATRHKPDDLASPVVAE